MSILDKIVEHKLKEVAEQKEKYALDVLTELPHFKKQVPSFSAAIVQQNKTGIIAEFKRQSPSKGVINKEARVEDVTLAYQEGGASCVSILTDQAFFGGEAEDLIRASFQLDIPILRKDFIVDSYQIYEAKAIGASAILLIAAILKSEEITQFTDLAHELGLEVLFEVHNEAEIVKFYDKIDVVGVNNRNLNTFEVDIDHSIQLMAKLPQSVVCITESGINDPATVIKMRDAGFKGFLIGECFMKEDDPKLAFKNFVDAIRS